MTTITLPRDMIERVIDSLRSAGSGWVPMQPLIDEIRTAIALHDLAQADRAAGLDYAQPCPYIRSSGEGTHWCALADGGGR